MLGTNKRPIPQPLDMQVILFNYQGGFSTVPASSSITPTIEASSSIAQPNTPARSKTPSNMSPHDLKLFYLVLKREFKRIASDMGSGSVLTLMTVAKLSHCILERLPNPVKMLIDSNPLLIMNLDPTEFVANLKIDDQALAADILGWVNGGLLKHLACPVFDSPTALEHSFEGQGSYTHVPNDQILAKLIDKNALWRLFVGAKLQEIETPDFYESRQPGALAAMHNALEFARNTAGQPLSSAHLEQIQKLCAINVQGLNSAQTLRPLGFRQEDASVGFGISVEGTDKNKSPEGYLEACLAAGTDYMISKTRVSTLLSGNALVNRIDTILDDYNISMHDANSRDKKVLILINLISHLERIHPFLDANCRAICVITFLRELIRHELPLSILDNPNQFDGFSVNEMFNAYAKGCQTLNKVLEASTAEADILAQAALLSPRTQKMRIF